MPRKPATQCTPHELKLDEHAANKAPPETGAIHARSGDRGNDDDDDDDDGDARRVPGETRTRDHPGAAGAVHARFGDRGNDDGGDDDAWRLPIYVRFRDISAAGIAKNWPTLLRLIEEEGFPRGVMLSPNIRAWRLDEIKTWLETRPVERKPVPTRWGGDRRIAT